MKNKKKKRSGKGRAFTKFTNYKKKLRPVHKQKKNNFKVAIISILLAAISSLLFGLIPLAKLEESGTCYSMHYQCYLVSAIFPIIAAIVVETLNCILENLDFRAKFLEETRWKSNRIPNRFYKFFIKAVVYSCVFGIAQIMRLFININQIKGYWSFIIIMSFFMFVTNKLINSGRNLVLTNSLNYIKDHGVIAYFHMLFDIIKRLGASLRRFYYSVKVTILFRIALLNPRFS